MVIMLLLLLLRGDWYAFNCPVVSSVKSTGDGDIKP